MKLTNLTVMLILSAFAASASLAQTPNPTQNPSVAERIRSAKNCRELAVIAEDVLLLKRTSEQSQRDLADLRKELEENQSTESAYRTGSLIMGGTAATLFAASLVLKGAPQARVWLNQFLAAESKVARAEAILLELKWSTTGFALGAGGVWAIKSSQKSELLQKVAEAEAKNATLADLADHAVSILAKNVSRFPGCKIILL